MKKDVFSAGSNTTYKQYTAKLKNSTCLSGKLFASLTLATITAISSSAEANPVGGTVVSGSANITQPSQSVTDITQNSGKAIINWQSFNIGAGETTQFIQPSATSVIYNRITGVDPSKIFGHLIANGEVVLVNPSGIIFGKNSVTDVHGLIASTADLKNADFNSGKYNFGTPGNAGASIINRGTITAKDAGLVALVAPGVENDGIIKAELGIIVLGAGQTATFDFNGDKLINFAMTGGTGTSGINNTGTVSANGGSVYMTARAAASVIDNAINTSGVVEAQSASVDGRGNIIFDGGQGNIKVSGKVDASGKGTGQKGGNITVATTGNIDLASGATLDASGDQGGGTIKVGGDNHGGGTLAHATDTTMELGANIFADAINGGTGGTVILWSDNNTSFNGFISAKGGAAFGDGGYVETSGKQILNMQGIVDASAAHGKAGTWLMDPEDAVITNSDSDENGSDGSASFTPGGTQAVSNINVSHIDSSLNAGTNVTVLTGDDAQTGPNGGSIIVAAPISATTGSGSLTLSSYKDIIVNAPITLGGGAVAGGNLTLTADNAGNQSGAIAVNANISTNGGSIAMGGGSGAAFGDSNVGNPYGGNSGVSINNVAVNAGSGNISINGQGYANGGGVSSGVIVYGPNGALQTTSGNITVNGVGGGTGNSNSGVFIDSGAQITTADGNIAVTGTGSRTASGVTNTGVEIDRGAIIQATGSGNISITGTGGTGSSENNGVETYANGTIASASGTINITGINGSGTGYGIGQDFEGNSFSIGSSAGGNISLTADSIAQTNGAPSVQTSGNVAFQPYSANTSIGFGGGVGTLQIPTSGISAGSLTIGSLSGTGEITVGTQTPAVNTTIQSGSGNIEFSGAQNLGANSLTANTGGEIDVDNALNAQNIALTGGTVNVNSGGSLNADMGVGTASIGGTTVSIAGSVSGDEVTINPSGLLTVASGANIAATDTASLSGGVIYVNGTVGANEVNLNTGGYITLDTGSQINASDSLTATASGSEGFSGNITAKNFSATSGSNVVFSNNPLSVSGDLTVNATGATSEIDVNSTSGLAATGTVSLTAPTINLNNDITGGAVSITGSSAVNQNSGTIEANNGDVNVTTGDLETSGTLSGTNVNVSGGTVNAYSSSAFSADATASSGHIANISGTNISINGSVSGDAVTLAATGTLLLDTASSTTATDALTASGTSVTLNGTTNAGSVSLTSSTGDISTGGASSTATTGSFSATSAGNVTLGGTLNAGGAATVNANGGDLNVNGASTAASFTGNASNNVNVNSSVTTTSGDVNLSAGNQVNFTSGTVSSAGNASITATNGDITEDSNSMISSGAAGTISLSGNNISVSGTLSGDEIGLTANNGGSLTLASSSSTTAGDSITASGAAIELDGTTSGNSISLTSNTGDITTGGSISTTTTSGDFVATSTGNVTLGGTLNAAGAATINANGGDLNANGASTAASFTGNASNNINVNSSITTTSGDVNLSASNQVNFTSGTVSSAGNASISGTNGINIDSNSSVSADMTSGSGHTASLTGNGIYVNGSVSGDEVTVNANGNNFIASGSSSITATDSVTANAGYIESDGTISAANVSLTGTNGGYSLIQYSGTIGATNNLTINSNYSYLTGTINSKDATISANGYTWLNGGTINSTGNLEIDGDSYIYGTVNDKNATFNAPDVVDVEYGGINSSHSLNINSYSIDIDGQGINASGKVDIEATNYFQNYGTISNTGSTTISGGNQAEIDASIISNTNSTHKNGDIIIAASLVDVNAPVSAAGNLTIEGDNININQAVSADSLKGTVDVAGNSGVYTNSSITGKNVDLLTNGSLNLDSGTAIAAGNQVNLSGDSATIGGSISGNKITANINNDINFNNTNILTQAAKGFSATSDNGNINVNGNLQITGQSVLESTNGTFTNNGTISDQAAFSGKNGITISSGTGTDIEAAISDTGNNSSVKLRALSGDVSVNAAVSSDDALKITADSGAIDLNAGLTYGTLTGSTKSGANGIVNVGGDYNATGISDAVTLANSGGTVNLAGGTYNQSVNVDKTVTLNGNGKYGSGSSVIDGGITVSGNNATVQNLGTQNATINIDVSGSGDTINNVSVKNAGTTGIQLEGTAQNAVIENTYFSGNGTYQLSAAAGATINTTGDSISASSLDTLINSNGNHFVTAATTSDNAGNSRYDANGLTGIFSNIASAIGAAVNGAAGSGDTVKVYAGTYNIPNGLNVNVSGLNLSGPNQGVAAINGRSTETNINGALEVSADNVTIDGFKFSLVPANNNNLYLVTADNNVIGTTVNNNIFTGSNNRQTAIYLSGGNDGASINDNSFTGFKTGISVNNSDDVTINANTFGHNNGRGTYTDVSMNNSSDASITGNSFNGNRRYTAYGVSINGGSNDSISGNNTFTGYTQGITAGNSDGITIDNNSFTNNINYDVVITSSLNAKIDNNNFTNQYVDPSTAPVFRTINAVAIDLQNSDDAEIIGNNITGYNVGAKFEGSSYAYLSTDDFQNNGTAIWLTHSHNGTNGSVLVNLANSTIEGSSTPGYTSTAAPNMETGILIDDANSSLKLGGPIGTDFNMLQNYFVLTNGAMAGQTIFANNEFFDVGPNRTLVKGGNMVNSEVNLAELMTIDSIDNPLVGTVYYGSLANGGAGGGGSVTVPTTPITPVTPVTPVTPPVTTPPANGNSGSSGSASGGNSGNTGNGGTSGSGTNNLDLISQNDINNLTPTNVALSLFGITIGNDPQSTGRQFAFGTDFPISLSGNNGGRNFSSLGAGQLESLNPQAGPGAGNTGPNADNESCANSSLDSWNAACN